ncbi:cupin domain-containing protein [Cytobacillus solani]|uniref:Cupin type-2 domain-containing protein n=1 Tax=Cytobacillus solani TaxID=1637975 RepID=A0A0Q3QTI2_9BACI|nr:cupin domain-containing protein [Cytobacillus solani]KOP71865.1 hypothetical protein AMS60_21470 [Bacillus sp. FJAT-21945]KQL21457.1 hypothetical protein AN957_24835 [Cytobacillus solani]USK54762.1 cupin domain-containing protein [Cytobacillus solani]
MYDVPYIYPNPYHVHLPMDIHGRSLAYWNVPNGVNRNTQWLPVQSPVERNRIELKDYGSAPFVVNINKAAKQNRAYRTALWTGRHLQVTLMSLKAGEDIGLEMHPNLDQFLRIEQGQGIVHMGNQKDHLYYRKKVNDDDAIMIPAGTWHNVTNTGNVPLKLYSIYAPPQHPWGTVHMTKANAMAAEHGH